MSTHTIYEFRTYKAQVSMFKCADLSYSLQLATQSMDVAKDSDQTLVLVVYNLSWVLIRAFYTYGIIIKISCYVIYLSGEL